VFELCRPVWRRWLRDAVLAGALELPGFASNPAAYLAVKWIPPKWDWVDPLKDRKAEIEAINSPGGSVFDGVWIDGIAASIASVIAMAGDAVVMPENALLVLHDPSGLVAGTAADMRAMADALDKMAAGMVAAYRDKSGRDDAEIEALMAAETWLSATEALELGFADRIEPPVRMAARFDLSRFRNPPPQLAALAAMPTLQEDEMSDSETTSPRKPDLATRTTVQAAGSDADATAHGDEATAGRGQTEALQPAAPAPEDTSAPQTTEATSATAGAGQGVASPQAMLAAPASPAQSTAQVIDLDAVRAEERNATLAYVAEVHELCALAAEDEATAIRSQVRPAVTEPAQPAIDTAAIYAARNHNVR
jgi:ATP-dependent Clp protease, protease subunit